MKEFQALVAFDEYGCFELTGPELRSVAGGYEQITVPGGATVGPVGVHVPGAYVRYSWKSYDGIPYPYPYNPCGGSLFVNHSLLNCPAGVNVGTTYIVAVQNPICGTNIGCGAGGTIPNTGILVLCNGFGP